MLQQAVLNTAPEPVKALPAGAWGALERALAKDRNGRYGSCTQFVAALAGESEVQSPKSKVGRPPSASRSRLVLAGGVVLLLLGVGVAGWYWGVECPRQRAAAQAERLAKEKARAAQETERQARIKAEADAYAALGATKTEAALKAFLEQYPEGAHAAEAKAAYDRLVTERQRQEAERQARIKAEADAYAALGATKTEETLKAFMEKYPDGAHVVEAKAAYDKLVADRQQREAAEAEKQRQQQAAAAKSKEEFAAYVLLQANKSEAGLQAFLERFPDGAHAGRRRRI